MSESKKEMSVSVLVGYATRYGSTQDVAEAIAAKLHLLDRLIASLPASPFHNEPASDVRDWTAIRAWASNLAAKLQSDLLPQ